ncbi:MAG: bacteriocin [Lachnospiraceae bacterium]|nr:bacteriocin [Lachnospiraceae bacterium]
MDENKMKKLDDHELENVSGGVTVVVNTHSIKPAPVYNRAGDTQ